MPPKPIEVVVIRDARPERAERARPEPVVRALLPPPAGGDGAGRGSDLPELAPDQQRELDALLEALHCPVRQQILLTLAAAGRANPTALEARTGIAQTKLSHHLAFLRTAGLVFSQRQGKEIWYETAEPRVRYQRDADGRFSLTLTARGSGVAVTLTVGVAP